MQQRDYFLLLVLMFMNLIVMAFFATGFVFGGLPFAFLCVLLLFDLLFIFGEAKKSAAFLFFGFSFASMIGLLIADFSGIFVLIAIIDLMILYYVHSFVEVSLYSKEALAAAATAVKEHWPERDADRENSSQAQADALPSMETWQDDQDDAMLPDRYDESLFTRLGYPTLKEMARAESTSFDDATYPVLQDSLAEQEGAQEEYPLLDTPAQTVLRAPSKKGYVHIDSLQLPTPKQRKEPSLRFRPIPYYDEPKATFRFTSIDELEQRITRAAVFSGRKAVASPRTPRTSLQPVRSIAVRKQAPTPRAKTKTAKKRASKR